MAATDDFQAILAKLRRGDPDAAEEIFRRYVRRLTALASRQFEAGLRDRADPEGVVQSVYKSFFSRDIQAPFDLDGWERLWSLLAVITVRKCWRRRRDLGRPEGDDGWIEAIDRQPGPLEAVELADLVARIFRRFADRDRETIELILQGCTAVEIAGRRDCSERTVRRLRDEIREFVDGLDDDARP